MARTERIAAALAALAAISAMADAHPSQLECGTDESTRLVPGRDQVMCGDVTIAPPGTGFSASLSSTRSAITVTTPPYFLWAARIMGAGTFPPPKAAGNLAATTNCSVQIYTNGAMPNTTTQTIAIAGATAATHLLVGFTNGNFGPGLYVLNVTAPSNHKA